MISLILMKKILSLFLILFSGTLLVKLGILKPEDSKPISALSIYLIMPIMILTSFEVDMTPQVRDGLLLAFGAAILIQILLIVVMKIMKAVFKLDPVEQASITYSNAGNLVIPLVAALFGEEWVIYSTAYVAVQMFFMWSHGKAILCGESRIDLKKILTNFNMISVLLGIVVLLTGFRFPSPVQDAMNSVKAMLGPSAMLVTGILIGGRNIKEILAYPRIWLVVILRLLVIPLGTLSLLKFTPLAALVENGTTILMISLLATITPSASSITQMAVVYDADADYAGAINVLTTLGCIVTMPIIIALYQL